eukprot:tig00021037_g17443.t1
MPVSAQMLFRAVGGVGCPHGRRNSHPQPPAPGPVPGHPPPGSASGPGGGGASPGGGGGGWHSFFGRRRDSHSRSPPGLDSGPRSAGWHCFCLPVKIRGAARRRGSRAHSELEANASPGPVPSAPMVVGLHPSSGPSPPSPGPPPSSSGPPPSRSAAATATAPGTAAAAPCVTGSPATPTPPPPPGARVGRGGGEGAGPASSAAAALFSLRRRASAPALLPETLVEGDSALPPPASTLPFAAPPYQHPIAASTGSSTLPADEVAGAGAGGGAGAAAAPPGTEVGSGAGSGERVTVISGSLSRPCGDADHEGCAGCTAAAFGDRHGGWAGPPPFPDHPH